MLGYFFDNEAYYCIFAPAMLYPESFETKTDFSAIRLLLKDKCISSLGKEKVEDIHFSSDFELIKRLLGQTDEMLRILQFSDETLPAGDFFDIREGLSRVRVEGLFLDENEVFELRRALEAVRRIVDFIRKQEQELFPELHNLLEGVGLFPEIIRRIDAILDKFGRVKDNASHELARIRKDIIAVQSSVSRSLNAILRQAQADGYVEKDVSPTLRDGRLVIPVSPAFKRKISGIVHDESATGKTVFIEPAQVVEANNRLRELEGEERREIIRILVEFTTFLRPFTEDILQSQDFLGEIDLLRAKALFAIQIKAIKPQFEDVCQLEWNRAIHPLLLLNLQKQGKNVVPLDIELNENQRILLISGPNAGGKSVCLKTVVLLQYMLQCGLLIPVHESSRCGLFERLFIDIGDEQSIENDLSTYSSHLTNMKFFIRNSQDKTLLLIDEFGTGTEPMIGGALAEATLERFNKNKAFGVITTHYTNLKHFAESAEGIVNGAMLYDRQHLQPLFQLQIGNPGSSFAIEIARKIGLPEDVIADAAEKVGSEHLDYDKHLQDIVRDKRYWENKRQQIRLKEKKLEAVMEKYETEMSDIKKHRREVIAKAREDAQQLMSDANARIENTIREIRESQADKEKTKLIRKELQDFKEQVLESLKEDKKVQKYVSKSEKQDAGKQVVQAGATVKLKGQQTTGKVLEIQGKNAIVAFGLLKSSVKIAELEVISNNQLKKEQKKQVHAVNTVTEEVRHRKLQFKSEIDVRGMRGDEALQAVTYFIDDAVMVGVGSVRILHGTGTGALRQMIRQYLATVHGVRTFRDEHVQFGGAGITVVEFDL
jgi:DNA mismatch repair protein MutS2